MANTRRWVWNRAAHNQNVRATWQIKHGNLEFTAKSGKMIVVNMLVHRRGVECAYNLAASLRDGRS